MQRLHGGIVGGSGVTTPATGLSVITVA